MMRRGLYLLLLLLLLWPTSSSAQPAVMFLHFDNDSNEAKWDCLGKGIADLLTSSMAGAEGLRVVERNRLQALIDELQLQRSKYFDPATAQTIGKGVGAKYAVGGAILALSPSLILSVRIIDISRGEVIKGFQVMGQEDQFFALEHRLVDLLIENLPTALSAKDKAGIQKRLEANRIDRARTALDYGTGLDLRDQGDLQGASNQMAQLLTAEPAFELAKSRYREIMKELFAAKDARQRAFSDAEQKLLNSLNRRLLHEHGWDAIRDAVLRMWPARVLRGRLLLKKVADHFGDPKSALPYLQMYRTNQDHLAAELLALQVDQSAHLIRQISQVCKANGSFDCLSSEDLELAATLGLPNPTESPMAYLEIHQIQQDLAELLVFGSPPYYQRPKFSRRICFYKLDPRYVDYALKLTERAIAVLKDYSPDDYTKQQIDEQTVSLLKTQAGIYLKTGESEKAIAKLQQILTGFPTSSAFPKIEALIRVLLQGGKKVPLGAYEMSTCEDPK